MLGTAGFTRSYIVTLIIVLCAPSFTHGVILRHWLSCWVQLALLAVTLWHWLSCCVHQALHTDSLCDTDYRVGYSWLYTQCVTLRLIIVLGIAGFTCSYFALGAPTFTHRASLCNTDYRVGCANLYTQSSLCNTDYRVGCANLYIQRVTVQHWLSRWVHQPLHTEHHFATLIIALGAPTFTHRVTLQHWLSRWVRQPLHTEHHFATLIIALGAPTFTHKGSLCNTDYRVGCANLYTQRVTVRQCLLLGIPRDKLRKKRYATCRKWC